MSETAPPSAPTRLPATLGAALARGFMGRCPRCGEGRIFRSWLKPRAACPCCQLDMSGQRSDDFPAYISIFLTGHILVPAIIILVLDYDLSAWTLAAILMPLALAMLLGWLQPAKGAVIAQQWWFGMHGFKRERLPEGDSR